MPTHHLQATNRHWNENTHTHTHNLHMVQQEHTAKIMHLAYSLRPKVDLYIVVTYDKN